MAQRKSSVKANEAKRELCFRELARRRLEYFIRYTYGDNYQMGWVHQMLCEKLDEFLEAVQKKESPRLGVFMPPRHGKSEIASRRFPAYAFGRNPDLNIISASYAASLSSRMNRDVQRIIDSDLYRNIFPKTTLNSTNVRSEARGELRNSDIFEIVGHKGSYRSAGVGGGITGMGADILIIDDPIKDRADADSAVVREGVYDWYTSTAYTRLSPGGGVLLIMTRWHEADLAGKIKDDALDSGNQYQLPWTFVNFPAIAESDEEHRKEGDPLHPERYDLEALLSIKAMLPSRDWACLYQQTPIVGSGTVFQEGWFKFWTPATLPRRFDATCHSWDMTFKDTDGSDYVVGQEWRKIGADIYLMDQVRGRFDFVKTCDQVEEFSAKHPDVLAKLVEEKANGAAVINTLQSIIPGLIPIIPAESKLARAYAVTPVFRSGNIYIPDPKLFPWVADFIHEFILFPAGAKDDQVDACTQAINYLLFGIVIPPVLDDKAKAFFHGGN